MPNRAHFLFLTLLELFEAVLRLVIVSRCMEAKMLKRIVTITLLAVVLLSLISVNVTPVAAREVHGANTDATPGRWDAGCLRAAAEHLNGNWRVMLPGYTAWVIATCWRPS